MTQIYKVFYNKQVILISNTKDSFLHYQTNAKIINSEDLSHKTIDEFIKNKSLLNLCVFATTPVEAFNSLKSLYTPITAAGGLVRNDNDEFLFIFRNGTWDLPKGKAEKNETIAETAIREVQEECGIGKLNLIKSITITYHIYNQKDKHFLKDTHWYLMTTKKNQKLKPQLEEGITELRWFNKEELIEVKANTYPSVLEIIESFIE